MPSLEPNRGRQRRRLALLLALGALLAPASVAAEAPREPFFPRAGNVGYDVAGYTVGLAFRPRTDAIRARARIDATATQRLSRFSLDLVGLEVTAVTVDGEPARFHRGLGKLKVEPAAPVRRGASFATVVRYQGDPEPVTDPDGCHEGWTGPTTAPSRSASRSAPPPGCPATTSPPTRRASRSP